MKTISCALLLLALASAAILDAMAEPLVLGFGQNALDQQAWETAAGGKMEFEVASIHLEQPGKFTPPIFPLDLGNGPIPPGGRFHADFPLAIYIRFAYKLWLTPEQIDAMLATLPKWVATDSFVIDARAEGNPTKDQMRLMVRSLLVKRFKMAAHFETRDAPVLAMALAKPGIQGPNLKSHAPDPLCDAPTAARSSPGDSPGMPPFRCNSIIVQTGPNQVILRSRDLTMAQVAYSLPGPGRLGRPVVDETGLSGTYDFELNFARENDAPVSPGAAATGDSLVPTFLEAVKDQLGLKLVPKKAPIQVLVIDHIERPSAN